MSFIAGSLVAARSAAAVAGSSYRTAAAAAIRRAQSPAVAASLVAARSPIIAHHVAQPQFTARRTYAAHAEESFDSFTERYVGFFDNVEDLFELQRGLNNCFAYDLVPAPEVIESALKAARRVNDFAIAVRVFEGIKEKVENNKQYEQYLEVLKPIREELGIVLKEEIYN